MKTAIVSGDIEQGLFQYQGSLSAAAPVCGAPTLACAQCGMQVFYATQFVLTLPAGHRFPMAKYQILRDRLADELPDVQLMQAPPATDGELAHALIAPTGVDVDLDDRLGGRLQTDRDGVKAE